MATRNEKEQWIVFGDEFFNKKKMICKGIYFPGEKQQYYYEKYFNSPFIT